LDVCLCCAQACMAGTCCPLPACRQVSMRQVSAAHRRVEDQGGVRECSGPRVGDKGTLLADWGAAKRGVGLGALPGLRAQHSRRSTHGRACMLRLCPLSRRCQNACTPGWCGTLHSCAWLARLANAHAACTAALPQPCPTLHSCIQPCLQPVQLQASASASFRELDLRHHSGCSAAARAPGVAAAPSSSHAVPELCRRWAVLCWPQLCSTLSQHLHSIEQHGLCG
jgi:hypothetical protein